MNWDKEFENAKIEEGKYSVPEKIEKGLPLSPREIMDIICDCYPELYHLTTTLDDTHKGQNAYTYIFNYKGKIYGIGYYHNWEWGVEIEEYDIAREMKPVITYDYKYIK